MYQIELPTLHCIGYETFRPSLPGHFKGEEVGGGPSWVQTSHSNICLGKGLWTWWGGSPLKTFRSRACLGAGEPWGCIALRGITGCRLTCCTVRQTVQD